MTRSKDLEEMREEFKKIDTDNSGFIEFKELEGALKHANIQIP